MLASKRQKNLKKPNLRGTHLHQFWSFKRKNAQRHLYRIYLCYFLSHVDFWMSCTHRFFIAIRHNFISLRVFDCLRVYLVRTNVVNTNKKQALQRDKLLLFVEIISQQQMSHKCTVSSGTSLHNPSNGYTHRLITHIRTTHRLNLM